MYNTNFAKIEGFFEDYRQNASARVIGSKHLDYADEIIKFSKNHEIMYYKSAISSINSHAFVIVPSIFNSVEILFLNSNFHFIDRLREYGDVYLINWLEIDDSKFNLNSYAIEAAEIITYVSDRTFKSINLIGHCIGGNIAIAASMLTQDLINNLTLLTTPWDFSHFKLIGNFHKKFNLDTNVEDLPLIPKIYIKILFFLLFPDYFNLKIEKYFNFTEDYRKELFIEVEHWLMSGVSLPKQAYSQIINELMIENYLLKKKWLINGKVIDIEKFQKPIFLAIAKSDQLVPRSSVLSLCTNMKNIKLIEMEGGHISYLIGSQLNEFFKQFKHWLDGEI